VTLSLYDQASAGSGSAGALEHVVEDRPLVDRHVERLAHELRVERLFSTLNAM
jgi:hypothetical protein